MATMELKDILVLSDDTCYLETLSFSKKFNLVILHSDHTYRHIENIDIRRVKDIKEHLTAKNIKFAEGLPLNWGQIMKSVIEDPKQFRDAGGLDFLQIPIANNTNTRRRKREDSKDPGPDRSKTQSSSQLLKVSTQESSGRKIDTEGRKKEDVNKPRQVSQTQKENMREDGSASKKSRIEEDNTGETGQTSEQRITPADSSPALRTVGEVSTKIRILDLLEHISRCQETQCGLAGCSRLKKIVSHTMQCRRLFCQVCLPMTDVLCVHARFCKVGFLHSYPLTIFYVYRKSSVR